ncbi:hypothetical protein GXW82_10720 [Streptacidiphilus sp. 4-A2]|nr:hypothetical protein [Streptacidiphilus sp. 4-A2]
MGYTNSYAYNTVGALLDQQDAASGGLPAETINYGYDTYGQPTSLGSNGNSYVTSVGYDDYGNPLLYSMGTSTDWVDLALTYDPQTSAVTSAETTDSSSSGVVDNTSYAWSNSQISKGAGLLTSTNDVQNGGATTDTQCFQYDWDQRLSQAWTATDNCAATPANGSSSTVGGVNPYWQSWTYTADGQRSTEIDHDTTGNTANDTTTSYNYPAAGSATDQPHTLSSTTATGPGASAQTANYTYDADGNTLSISGGAAGAQSMTWNDQGKLAGDSSSSGSTSYLYDTDGNLILRTDPGTATLFLGDEQIVENTATASLTATRYYSLGGTSVAERSNTGDVQYLIPDRQGSDTLAIDASAMQAVTRRQYTPFGQVRGTAPASWPGDKGYVGGTTDAATDLENLGAREYDPAPGASSAPTRSWRPPTPPALRLRLCRQRPRHRQRPVGQLCLRRRRHLHEQPTRHRRGRRPAGRVHPAPTRIGRWCRGQRLRGGADQRARFRGGEQPLPSGTPGSMVSRRREHGPRADQCRRRISNVDHGMCHVPRRLLALDGWRLQSGWWWPGPERYFLPAQCRIHIRQRRHRHPDRLPFADRYLSGRIPKAGHRRRVHRDGKARARISLPARRQSRRHVPV